jgi:hypothetical protein
VIIRASVKTRAFIENLRMVTFFTNLRILRVALFTTFDIRAFYANASVFDISIGARIHAGVVIQKQFRGKAIKAFIAVCAFFTICITFFTFIQSGIEVVTSSTSCIAFVVF